MRLPRDDRTARAIIRDEALRLFAERGAAAVSVRDIAGAAGVSPALVLRHYGSKDGLRDAVSGYAVGVFDAALRDAVPGDDPATLEPAQAPSVAERITQHLPADSPVPAYLSRMLIDGGDGADELFRRLHGMAVAALQRLVRQGLATDGQDLEARAAFLLANDLAVIMLRGRIHAALGVDPLSGAGLERWGRQLLAVYGGGLAASLPTGPPVGKHTGRD